MDWSKIKESKCPHCGKQLSFRIKGSNTKIAARYYQKKALKDDYYFCFRCDFQISKEKLDKLSSTSKFKTKQELEAEKIVNEILRSVLSR